MHIKLSETTKNLLLCCSAFGFTMILAKGNLLGLARFVGLSAVSGAGMCYYLRAKEKKPVSHRDVILITGCDSGLG